jgi:hypothetical protein
MLQKLNPFYTPRANELVTQSLVEYERKLVEQEAAAAYHAKMAEYYREGIDRLSKYGELA